jgi:hypothetical protein
MVILNASINFDDLMRGVVRVKPEKKTAKRKK